MALAALDLAGVPSPALRTLATEVATDAGIRVAAAGTTGSTPATRLTVVADDASFAGQAYRLSVTAGSASLGPAIEIRAGDEAGAWNGLLSLAHLVVAEGSGTWIRTADIADAPGFRRRGVILDPYVLPDVGVTEASKALLMARLRFAIRYKANFLDLVDRVPWPALVSTCADHHVELMNGLGYQNSIVDWGPTEMRRRIDEVMDAGTRSIALNFDDLAASYPVALATSHAAAFNDLYGYIRGRDPGCLVSTVLVPYGGVPGRRLVGSEPGQGEQYLAVMRDALPADVRVFWTGDGGVFSPTVTASGARAYRDAIGHEIALWDNDTITYARERKACRGRAADLGSVVPTYMGNLAGESPWTDTNGEFALVTSLLYAWNPQAYDPDRAADTANRITSRFGRSAADT